MEIRAYRDRLERDRTVSQTRTRTGASIKEPQRLDPSPATPTVRVNYKADMDDKFKQVGQFFCFKVSPLDGDHLS